jgi:hypothetical protein
VFHHLKLNIGKTEIAAAWPDDDVEVDVDMFASQGNRPGAGRRAPFDQVIA